MSSASLAVPRHAHPDSVRIAAMSVAIGLNVVALVALMRPMAPVLLQQAQQAVAMPITWITAPPKVPDPPAVELKKLPDPKPLTHPKTVPVAVVQPPPVTTTTEGTITAPPEVPTQTTAPPDTGVSAAPVEATLAYRATPLKYPMQALHARAEGQVLLKVLVDENGVPLDVVIEKSSGSTVLDRSAREQVLKGWRFEPATVGGHAVKAWARVPVTFNINQL